MKGTANVLAEKCSANTWVRALFGVRMNAANGQSHRSYSERRRATVGNAFDCSDEPDVGRD